MLHGSEGAAAAPGAITSLHCVAIRVDESLSSVRKVVIVASAVSYGYASSYFDCWFYCRAVVGFVALPVAYAPTTQQPVYSYEGLGSNRED